MNKKKPLRFLSVMDPLGKLDPEWDNSLAVLGELSRRGHETWSADSPDIWATRESVFASCRKISQKGKNYKASSRQIFDLAGFDLILFRKEPPFDESFLHLTYLLEKASERVPVLNHPRGIRNANEKLSVLNFPAWIPETLVSSSAKQIMSLRKKIGATIIVKPLDQKGGQGIFLVHKNDTASLKKLIQATQKGRTTLMAQRFLTAKKKVEKRIMVLNGKILAVYEKRPRGKEFRGNLGLGATFHACQASAEERKLVAQMRSFLLSEGLSLVGLDTLNGKLIELNVTCPAGLTEAKFLGLKPDPVAVWASFLEDYPRSYAPKR